MSGGLIVDLNGTIGLSNTGVLSSAVINVVRGTSLAGTIFYAALVTLGVGVTEEVVPFMAQDLNAPAGIETAYSAFVSLVTGALTRVGPETFWGIASQG